jgi:uncharacterized membrane protein YhaH (DUF805 family)
VTFQESIKACLANYATFTGRASRSEFWWWFLFMVLATAAGGIISDKLAALVSLASVLPYLAVTARRLHDIDRSGWWQLISLIPVIGGLVLLYWCVQPSGPANRFGSSSD